MTDARVGCRRLCAGLIALVVGWASAAAAQVADDPERRSDEVATEATEPTSDEQPGAPEAAARTSSDDEAPPDGVSAKQLQRAKRLFHQGNTLRKTGEYASALTFYLESRAVLASVANTLNAAVCLDQLGRFDEALQLYEVLLTEFGAKLTDDERRTLAPALATLRAKVGNIDVTANVAGKLVIDGRPRGELPLLHPVRVMPGAHRVTVLADDYLTFHEEIFVEVRATTAVNAVLEPLAERGTLRVARADLNGAHVFVDGAAVGIAPWRGALAPGKHLFFLRRDDEGSAPQQITIVENQQVDAEATLSSLAPEVELRVTPSSAALTLDDVPLGNGRWRGRLPLGEHVIEATEDGYVAVSRRFELDPHRTEDVHLTLETDEDHPRWGTAEVGMFWGDAFGGYALAPTLGSDAEAACESGSCTSNDSATGWLVGARIGYELPVRVGVYLAGGYLALRKTIDRSYDTSFETGNATVQARYALRDELRLRGPFAGGGLSYRLPMNDWLQLHGNMLVGAFIAKAADSVDGSLTASDGTSATVAVPGSDQPASAVDLFFMPSISIRGHHRGFRAGVGLGVSIFALAGPPRPADGSGALLTDASTCQSNATSHASCAPASDVVNGEKAYGSFVMWLPCAMVGYAY